MNVAIWLPGAAALGTADILTFQPLRARAEALQRRYDRRRSSEIRDAPKLVTTPTVMLATRD